MELTVERYKNVDGSSGVLAFDIGLDIIIVAFKNGNIYEYTSLSTGKQNLNRMAQLARSGSGLHYFINKHVRKKYARKIQ